MRGALVVPSLFPLFLGAPRALFPVLARAAASQKAAQYYDKGSHSSDIRKDRKIAIFLTFTVAYRYTFTISNRKIVNQAGNLVFLAFSKSFCF